MTDAASVLRNLLARPGAIRFMGAHNALGAKLAERAGFDGIWASSLEIAASYAVPDSSIVTQSEHLAAARSMRMAVDIPVIADCDTGYGGCLQFAHAVRQFEAAGVAGVCIEDKQFPKQNSFTSGKHDLAPVAQFGEKLRAGKRAQRDRNFVIIARVEALIAGRGKEEALRRAHAYADAGADAILVHSKAPVVDELASVVLAWDRAIPLVAVPTTYYRATVEELQDLGIKMIIYANQGLRCALFAMERAYAEILRHGSTACVEDRLWPMNAIFDLQGVDANGDKEAIQPMAKTATKGTGK
jgi:phosphoenolpyruvate phosphomutase